MTKSELIKDLQEREQEATERDTLWGHQRQAGRADAYRMAIGLLKRLDVPSPRWKTGTPPHDTEILFQWPDGEYDLTVWCVEDDPADHCCRWLPFSDILALIAPPEEPDGFTIPGWDME